MLDTKDEFVYNRQEYFAFVWSDTTPTHYWCLLDTNVIYRCNSENIHLKCLHLGIVWLRFFLRQNVLCGIFWHTQMVVKLYWGYVLATNFVCQNISQYICAWWNMFACYTDRFCSDPKFVQTFLHHETMSQKDVTNMTSHICRHQ